MKTSTLASQSRRKFRIFASLALLLSLAIFAGIWIMPQPQHQTVMLATGEVVELLGYSYGTRHELRLPINQPGWRGFLWRFNPPVARAVTTSSNVMVLWVRMPDSIALKDWQGQGRSVAIARGPKGELYSSNALYTGQVTTVVGNSYGTASIRNNGMVTPENIEAFVVPCFPRRLKTFDVEIDQYGSPKPLAVFHVTNPNRSSNSAFVPETLPSTKSDGSISVTINAVNPINPKRYVDKNGNPISSSQSLKDSNAIAVPGSDQRYSLSAGIFAGGKVTRDWLVSEITASDATGNSVYTYTPIPGWPCREFTPPSRTEAYKLTLGVQKNFSSAFDKDEIWLLNNLPLPVTGKPTVVNKKFSRDDCQLTLESIYGMDGKDIRKDIAILNLRISGKNRNPLIYATVTDMARNTLTGPWPDNRLLFGPNNLTVMSGHVVQMHTGSMCDGTDDVFSVPFIVPPACNHINVNMRVSHTRRFEFTVGTSMPVYSN